MTPTAETRRLYESMSTEDLIELRAAFEADSDTATKPATVVFASGLSLKYLPNERKNTVTLDKVEAIDNLELYAWVGMDDRIDGEPRSGEIGIKQGVVPAGYIPIVAIRRDKIDTAVLWEQMESLAQLTGVRRYLVRLRGCEIVAQTKAGT